MNKLNFDKCEKQQYNDLHILDKLTIIKMYVGRRLPPDLIASSFKIDESVVIKLAKEYISFLPKTSLIRKRLH